MTPKAALLTSLLPWLAGCGMGPYDPPPVPVHDVSQDGYLHARGYNTPYLCGDGAGGRTACPEEEPEAAKLSCDASGCHGNFDYAPGADPDLRSLNGDDAPSCFTCHGREWSDRKE